MADPKPFSNQEGVRQQFDEDFDHDDDMFEDDEDCEDGDGEFEE